MNNIINPKNIVIFILICLGVFISLMTNYASTLTPEFLQKHPSTIWIFIIVGILLTLVFSIIQSNMENIKKFSTLAIKHSGGTKNTMSLSKYDVFISYSGDDTTWVHEKLVKFLESRGFNVLTNKKFLGGSLSIEQMTIGVEKSRHVIAVLSQNFLQSSWTKFETAMAQTLNPDASFRKLIPVIIDSCEIPLNIRILHYRDLRNKEEWEKLVEDII